MALETLTGIKEVGGFEVTGGVSNFGKDRPIFIHHDTNQIAFQIQNGPIKEYGVNGCQVDQMIQVATLILTGLNKNVPSRETALAITKLEEATHWLDARRKDREKRGVEGFHKA